MEAVFGAISRASGKRVAVALSGGVDSTVVALLLKERGCNVVGVYMRNWDERNETGYCRADEEWTRVQSVCKRLRIDCVQVNFIKQYWNKVFTPLLDGYATGKTPNPDVLCNQEIKFSALLDHCKQHLDAELLATGHYAQLRVNPAGSGKELQLCRAVDSSRDQTYFLSAVQQAALQCAAFPLGGFMKADVFRMARDGGFADIAALRESRGLCFIGKRKFTQFLSEYIEDQPGPIMMGGKVVGQHSGLHTKTVGQAVHFKWQSTLPKPKQPRRFYVWRRDSETNALHVVLDGNDTALWSRGVVTHRPHWISGQAPDGLSSCSGLAGIVMDASTGSCKYPRNVALTLDRDGDGGLLVTCDKPLPAASPGQYAVFYDGDVCMGSAEIKEFIAIELPDLAA